jgi:hypothetical protein
MSSMVQVILGETRAIERCGEAGGLDPEEDKAGKSPQLFC